MESVLKENNNTSLTTYNFDDDDFQLKKIHEDNMKRQWSHLPDDILRSLISKMTLADQIRFCAVCKSWQQPLNNIRPIDNLPWMMLYKWTISRSVCKFYDPSYKTTYVVEDCYKPEEIRSKFVGARVCASKYGWVLCSVEKNTNKYNATTTFFVYNPFRKDVIELPELGMGFKKATFSSTPTSPDCLFLAVSEANSKTFIINICQRGDKTWKTFYVDGFFGSVFDVTYMKGSFYCLLSTGDLGAFNVALQEWRLLNTVRPYYFGSPYKYSLIVSDGQILTVRSEEVYKRPHAFRFDMKQKNWVKEERLRNQALFVDPCGTSFSLPAVDEAIKYADTIICKGGFPYSLETSCFKTGINFWGKASYSQVLPKDLATVWIEPPQLSSLFYG